jgi:hypothetical protein
MSYLIEMNNDIFLQELSIIIKNYLSDIQSELKIRWNNWEVEYEKKELYEVTGGLLSRHIHLTTYFLQSSTNWNSDFAGIFLRVLVEAHLNLAWILKEDSLNRAKQFIEYGLGQEKLLREKYKLALEKDGKLEQFKEAFKKEEHYWNQERYNYLTNINLGGWAGISAYQMAKEIGDEDFYNIVYSPFSNSVHSTWNHIIKFNVERSKNPLHGHIKVPSFKLLSPDIHYVELTAKYLQMSFDVADKAFPLKISIESSREKLLSEIDRLTEKMRAAINTKGESE